jgi:hypothetical protein
LLDVFWYQTGAGLITPPQKEDEMRDKSWDYPPGAEHDSRAPWNQKENPFEHLEEARNTLRHFAELMDKVMDIIGKKEFDRRFGIKFEKSMEAMGDDINDAMGDAEEGEL